MKLKDVIEYLEHNVLVNITNVKQARRENLVRNINQSLTHIHSIFNIRFEQATIVIPENRRTFKISDTDSHVIMSSYNKIAKAANSVDKLKLNKLLESVFSDKVELDKKLKEIMSKDIISSFDDKERPEVLQIVGAEDDTGKEYLLNWINIFLIDSEEVYLPNAEEGDIVYVMYKPKPKLCSLDRLDEEIDLPDTLLRVLYSHIALNVLTTVEGYSQEKYPNIYQTYTREVQNAYNNGADIPDSLECTAYRGKGFF